MTLKNIVVVWVLSMLLIACGDKPHKYDSLGYGDTVLAFGDSVTFGYGVSPDASYPMILSELSSWTVVNSGISGERADQAKHRITEALNEHAPKVVIIELGGNDFLQRRSSQLVKEDLRAIIQSVKQAGAIPVLVAVPALSPVAALTGKPSDSGIYAELAKEENINVISNVFSDILGKDDLKQDMVHPNQAGYRVLAEGIYNALKNMGL